MTLPTNEQRTPRSARVGAGAASPIETSGRDRETRRELAKLTANYYNSVAASIFAIGALAPIVALLSGQIALGEAGWVGGLAFIGFALSLVVHLGARYVLRREFQR